MPLFKNKEADKTTVNATLRVSTTTTTTAKKTAATPEEVFGKRFHTNTKTDDRLDKAGAYEKGQWVNRLISLRRLTDYGLALLAQMMLSIRF
jgi:hypothetical protein